MRAVCAEWEALLDFEVFLLLLWLVLFVVVVDFFFFFLVVELVELLWPDAAFKLGDEETTSDADRISAPKKREVGEFCTLIYPM